MLLVGEVNPLSNDPYDALVPWPDGCSGHRLMKHLGLTRDEYLACHRTNLCVGVFDPPIAKWKAQKLLMDPSAGWRSVLVLGRAAQVAFGFPWHPAHPFFGHKQVLGGGGPEYYFRLYCFPHPSGLNRMWLDPKTVKLARATFAEAKAWEEKQLKEEGR